MRLKEAEVVTQFPTPTLASQFPGEIQIDYLMEERTHKTT